MCCTCAVEFDEDGDVLNVVVPSSISVRSFTCSHVWIDPAESPIARAPYVPLIGDGRHMMKRGTVYRCSNCSLTLDIPRSTNDDSHVDRMGSQR